LIIDLDVAKPPTDEQVTRFCDLLFGSNRISPTKIEYGMFAAKAAALRSLDLSRQIGAAICSIEGDIICVGLNEVPKAEGGSYWSGQRLEVVLRSTDVIGDRKLHPAWIRIVRQNHRIIECDVCYPARARNVRRRPVQVEEPA
jgi:hypothetical protein